MADSHEWRLWIKFFTEAGIPPTSAEDYALIFAENRIQKNMLLDLNKEYLKDMGITLMGDVIAILRHAKTVHDQVAREKVLSSKVDEETSPIRTSHQKEEDELPHVKKTGSVVTRILDHYTRNSIPSSVCKTTKTPESMVSRTLSNKDSEKKMRIVAPLKHKTGTLKSDHIEEKELSTLQNTRTSVSKIVTSTVSSSDSPVPVKKCRRVLPEHEGGYTIKYPNGSTPRSKEILEKFLEQREKAKAKTVFDRLGSESYVTSTTQSEEPVAFKVTFNNNTIIRNESTEKLSSSVFERLGNKKLKEGTATTQITESQRLQYNGILKSPSTVKKILKEPSKSLTTMRADEPKVPVKLRATLKSTLVKSKVGLKKNIVKKIKSRINSGTEGILGKSNFDVRKKTPVKNRLGSSSKIAKKQADSLKRKDDFKEGKDRLFVTDKESKLPTAKPKRVTFGENQEKLIPKILPSNIGSIVLGTGMFKRN